MKAYYTENILKFQVSGTTYTLKKVNGDYGVYQIDNGDLIKLDINIPDWQDPEYPDTGERPPFEEKPVANNVTEIILAVVQAVLDKAGATVTEVKGKAVGTTSSSSGD